MFQMLRSPLVCPILFNEVPSRLRCASFSRQMGWKQSRMAARFCPHFDSLSSDNVLLVGTTASGLREQLRELFYLQGPDVHSKEICAWNQGRPRFQPFSMGFLGKGFILCLHSSIS